MRNSANTGSQQRALKVTCTDIRRLFKNQIVITSIRVIYKTDSMNTFFTFSSLI